MKRKRLLSAPREIDPVEEEPVSNEVEIAQFKSWLRIDKFNLDHEVAEQPQRFSDVADRCALAESRRDEAKDHLKTVEAELLIDERLKAEETNSPSTEKFLAAKVQIRPERRAAFRRLIEADRTLNEWAGLKESWKDRSFMIRELCGLHLSTIFGKESISSSDVLKREVDATRAKQVMAQRRKERQGRSSKYS